MSGDARGGGIVLIGYRGTGKTTVGRILSRHLAVPFVDADHALESRFGRTIRSIFAELGEPVFRDYEEEVLLDLTANRTGILSTGGGAILRETNRRAIKGFGRVVWLTAGPDVLAKRIGVDPRAISDRPSLTSAGTIEEIAAVLETRKPLYEATADLAISTEGRTTSEVAEAILKGLAGR